MATIQRGELRMTTQQPPPRISLWVASQGKEFRRKWREELGVSRTNLVAIVCGRDLRVDMLARLVRAASKVMGRPVRASELYDLGDDAPYTTKRSGSSKKNRPPGKSKPSVYVNPLRRFFDTPLDHLITAHRLKPAAVARKAGITRQAFCALRAARTLPRVTTLAKIVVVLRELTGKPITARDLGYDLGEDDIRCDT